MINKLIKNDEVISSLYSEISNIINSNKEKMTYQINNALINTYFLIGKTIVENEQNGNIRAEYGKEILLKLSKKLTNDFGKGFSLSSLYNMRLFYDKYKNFQPVGGNFKKWFRKNLINHLSLFLIEISKEITMEYAIGGLSNNLFASTYTYYIPNKEQLINEVEKVLMKNI